jgi:hypothetical protein
MHQNPGVQTVQIDEKLFQPHDKPKQREWLAVRCKPLFQRGQFATHTSPAANSAGPLLALLIYGSTLHVNLALSKAQHCVKYHCTSSVLSTTQPPTLLHQRYESPAQHSPPQNRRRSQQASRRDRSGKGKPTPQIGLKYQLNSPGRGSVSTNCFPQTSSC